MQDRYLCCPPAFSLAPQWLPHFFHSRIATAGGKGKAAIANHLRDHMDHVFVRQQSQKLAGEAAVPYGVVACCEVEKHSSGLLLS